MNPVVHFEIAGSDRRRLSDFYGAVFGWRIDQQDEMDYGMVDTRSSRGFNGGITTAPEGQANGVIVYVGVPDIQERLDKAVALGGELVVPVTQIPDVVTFAVFRDPHGNATGLVSTDGTPPPRSEEGGTPVTWFEIIGKDASIQDFYRDLFDWKISDMSPVAGYGTVGWEDWGFGGGIGVVGEQSGPYVTIYPEVADVDATLRAVEANGGEIVMPATDMPEVGIRAAAFRDPDGIMVGAYKQIPNA